MTALEFSWEQRQQLARRFGIDDPNDLDATTLVRRARELRDAADRARARSFEDADLDPTGILKLGPMTATRTATKTPVGYTEVLAAKADGRIEPSEGPKWFKLFEQDEHFARETLNALYPDPVRAQAFEENPEIRNFADQLDSLTGVAPEDRVEYAERAGNPTATARRGPPQTAANPPSIRGAT
jgi:hypothetical protein